MTINTKFRQDFNQRVYVAGHRGMAGSAILRELKKQGFNNIIVANSDDLDLRMQSSVQDFFQKNKPNYVYLAAAKVGGIYANEIYPADFIYENLMIQSNIIRASYEAKVERLMFLGSSCIYPKFSPQPITPDSLLKGELEKTNEPYAIAKIAGIKMCESFNNQYHTDFRCVMPTNLYGIGDNYHPNNSHVVAGLIKRIHEAKISKSKSVTMWGSGKALREFLNVDDFAKACVFLMRQDKDKFCSLLKSDSHVNIGSGEEVSILDLTNLICKVIGYEGEIINDFSMKDGTPRKFLDSTLIKSLGWSPQIKLSDGLKIAYKNFLESKYVSMGNSL